MGYASVTVKNLMERSVNHRCALISTCRGVRSVLVCRNPFSIAEIRPLFAGEFVGTADGQLLSARKHVRIANHGRTPSPPPPTSAAACSTRFSPRCWRENVFEYAVVAVGPDVMSIGCVKSCSATELNPFEDEVTSAVWRRQAPEASPSRPSPRDFAQRY